MKLKSLIKENVRDQLQKLAHKLNDKNYSSITGQISDILLNADFSSEDSGTKLGPTTVSWELWKNPAGEKIKIRTTLYPSGKTTIAIL